MFKIKRTAANRLDIDLGGKIESDEMNALIDALVSESEGIVTGRMRYNIREFRLPTPGAMGVELSRLPALLKFLRKFERMAVVTDKSWIGMVSEFEGALIPGLTIKAFGLDEDAEAEAWLKRTA